MTDEEIFEIEKLAMTGNRFAVVEIVSWERVYRARLARAHQMMIDMKLADAPARWIERLQAALRDEP